MNDNGEMFPPATIADVSIDDKVKEIERELAKRWHVYPRMVADHKMNKQEADRKILVLEAVLDDLRRYQAKVSQ